MFVSDSLNVNEAGHLTFAGLDTVDLANEYKTPLYVFDEDLIRMNCRAFQSAINAYYDGNGAAAYASKAFCCIAAAKIMKDEGMHLDTVSAGEIFTAIKAGFPTEKILFHGNNKSDGEIAFAIDNNVGRIVVDGESELKKVNDYAKFCGKTAKVLIRVTPGIDAHTHSFVRTGQIDSKFGITLENGDALKAVKDAINMENIDLAGLHCHIGSLLFDSEPFEHAADVMISFMREIYDKYGFVIRELDLGGGFGIRYDVKDERIDYSDYMRRVLDAVKQSCDKYGVKRPFILVEPGRSIVGEAGITLYTVGRIKEIPDIRSYVAVDGGMTDNPRYALYESHYEACIANRASQERSYIAAIAGKCCESGDMIQYDAPIQPPKEGDILAVFSTGAYNYSMSSNYNRICKPAVVMISNGKARVAVRRETFDDLIRNDVNGDE